MLKIIAFFCPGSRLGEQGSPGSKFQPLGQGPGGLPGLVRNDGAFAAFGVLTGEGWFNLLPGEDASCPDGRFECLNG